MEPGPVTVGVVDIGTNSMRLLITSTEGDVGRWVEVTGLGEGLDASGELAESAMARTITALSAFGALMDEYSANPRKAIATSASRDASNREEFFDRVTRVLGVRPTLIDGHTEARYAFDGAVGESEVDVVVSDIGGGSSEFVTHEVDISVDIGSVRLGERCLPVRPATGESVERARAHVAELFEGVEVSGERLIGVAGTWTSLASIDLADAGGPDSVDGHELHSGHLDAIVDRLSRMDLKQTRQVPGLDPARAKVILPGAVVASGVMKHLGVETAMVSERDTLDGVAKELLARPQF